jgi:hypothetical protein
MDGLCQRSENTDQFMQSRQQPTTLDRFAAKFTAFVVDEADIRHSPSIFRQKPNVNKSSSLSKMQTISQRVQNPRNPI